MTYGSSVPDAVTGLFTLLAARPGLAHVKVLDHYPSNADSDITGDTGLKDVVFLGREGDSAIEGTSILPHLGHSRFDETYVMWVTCQSLKDTTSGTEIAARQRAYELQAEVLGTVLTDPRLGLTDTAARSMFHVGLGGTVDDFNDGGGFLSPAGFGWRVSVGLHCTARIALT